MYYSFQDGQFLYLVMEFLPGGEYRVVHCMFTYIVACENTTVLSFCDDSPGVSLEACTWRKLLSTFSECTSHCHILCLDFTKMIRTVIKGCGPGISLSYFEVCP